MTSNPAIFEKAILGSDDYDEDLRELSAEGLDARQIFERLAIKDVQLAADVLQGGLGRGRRRRRLRVARGLALAGARHRGHARGGALVLGASGPPEHDDQDPGHRGGAARDRAGHLRGHQRQRDAALQGRVLRGRDRALHPRTRAPARRGQVAWTSTPWRASSSRAWTPRSTAASRRSVARTCRAAPGSPTPARPTSASRRSSSASASRGCAKPARRCSARSGRPPA